MKVQHGDLGGGGLLSCHESLIWSGLCLEIMKGEESFSDLGPKIMEGQQGYLLYCIVFSIGAWVT